MGVVSVTPRMKMDGEDDTRYTIIRSISGTIHRGIKSCEEHTGRTIPINCKRN